MVVRALLVTLLLSTPAYSQELSTASTINNRGDIAGGSTTSGPNPFVGWVIANKSSETIGTFGGPATLAYGSNDRGDVVGQSDTADIEANEVEFISQAFLLRQGVVTNLGTLPGFNNSQAYAINNGGTIVGWSYNESPLGPFTEQTYHAFAYDVTGRNAGVMRDLGTLGGATSIAFNINNAGAVVGRSRNASGQDHAFVLAGGVFTDLGTLGGNFSEARAISDTGVIVGMARTSTGVRRAFAYARGVMTELPSLGGPLSRAFDVNNGGDIVGQSVNALGEIRAVLWRNGAIIDLGTLGGGYATALSINERGEIVGESETATGDIHAFVWRNGVMTDLGALD